MVKKNAHYAGIMLNNLTIALCPKLCRHNISNPTSGEISAGLFSRTAAGSQAKDDSRNDTRNHVHE